MKKFSLVMEHGHLFMSDEKGGWFVVDTGTPTTVYEFNQLHFMDRVHPVQTSFAGLTVDSLRNFIPNATKNIVGLLGNDVMSNYWVEFDTIAGEASFGDGDAPSRDNSFVYQNMMSVPLISMQVDGRQLNAFLDSGANLSYVKSAVSADWESLGVKQDFYPMYGSFESPHFIRETVVKGKTMDVNYGNLPGILNATLSMGVDAILGVDLFANSVVMIDYRINEMAIN